MNNNLLIHYSEKNLLIEYLLILALFINRFLRNPTELKNIKNISLLRQQMSPTRVVPQAPVKIERCEDDNADEDMPTDLSMAASEPWRKRARPDPQLQDKHRISALIGENILMKREPEYATDHYALNLSDKCEQ